MSMRERIDKLWEGGNYLDQKGKEATFRHQIRMEKLREEQASFIEKLRGLGILDILEEVTGETIPPLQITTLQEAMNMWMAVRLRLNSGEPGWKMYVSPPASLGFFDESELHNRVVITAERQIFSFEKGRYKGERVCLRYDGRKLSIQGCWNTFCDDIPDDRDQIPVDNLKDAIAEAFAYPLGVLGA